MPRRGEPTERTCIVTRETLPVERLIRFVAAPDGSVVADLRRRLPGRGVWVKAEAGLVRAAERRNLFARAFDQPVMAEPGLAERVEESLRTAALGALSLARKAGEVVSGFAKVEAAIGSAEVVGVIHAAEAGEDGVAKLGAALRRRAGAIGAVPVIRIFTGEQLDLAFGGANVIHAALLAGPASRNTLFRVRSLADFLGEGMGAGDQDRAVAVASNVSAGP
jgi:predicted RNA-binding protein YlxR (DUF448 family)